MIKNTYKIPVGVWNTFTAEGKVRFNNMMDKALPNQKHYIHPMAFEMEHHHWRALVYNMACLAAWNEFDLNYELEEPVNYSAVEKLTKMPRCRDTRGWMEDAETV
jgi:hypothetical protein